MRLLVLTLVPGSDQLQTIDHLRIEPRGDFDAHACWIKQKVEKSKVAFLPPSDLILLDDASEDRISLVAKIDETHFCYEDRLTRGEDEGIRGA